MRNFITTYFSSDTILVKWGSVAFGKKSGQPSTVTGSAGKGGFGLPKAIHSAKEMPHKSPVSAPCNIGLDTCY